LASTNIFGSGLPNSLSKPLKNHPLKKPGVRVKPGGSRSPDLILVAQQIFALAIDRGL
jgi:hypothetical protein